MAGALFLSAALICCPSPIALLLAAAIHELGHVAAALILGLGLPRISFKGCGISLVYGPCRSPWAHVAVALSGCAAGLIPCLVPFSPFGQELSLYCIGLCALNLLPIRGLDGNEALEALLYHILLPGRAYLILRTVRVAAVLFLWGAAIFVQLRIGANITLLAVAVYFTVTVLASDGK